MTIQKPDFNQIFASQAPDVDKPPVFNNYNGGMGDEYRPNNGKPTIKGFNYIQNLNDNKFLWMVQNGAFPYDPNTEYAVGVVTIKDGRFKQWSGTDWVNFGQDDSALKKDSNLSDLSNKEASRTNLDVYSKSETDAKLTPTPNATETTAGKAKIATTAIAQAGVNDTDFLTPLKLKNTVFGIGATRKLVTLISGTTYTNTTNKVKFFNVYFVNSPDYLTLKFGSIVRGNIGASGTAGGGFYLTIVVLPGEEYSVTYGSSYTVWEIS